MAHRASFVLYKFKQSLHFPWLSDAAHQQFTIMFHWPVMTNLFLIWIPETYICQKQYEKSVSCFLLKYLDPPTALLQTVGP